MDTIAGRVHLSWVLPLRRTGLVDEMSPCETWANSSSLMKLDGDVFEDKLLGNTRAVATSSDAKRKAVIRSRMERPRLSSIIVGFAEEFRFVVTANLRRTEQLVGLVARRYG